MRGIDVSSANGTIDWDAVKDDGIDFAIIRIGWGDDIVSQDDAQADRNMDECERLGIPYGAYLYSYAMSDEECDSEIRHAKRMIADRKPVLGVWYDMEDADGYKEEHGYNPYEHPDELTDFCYKFVTIMKNYGYKSGVYANASYWRNIVDYDKFDTDEVWLAHWGIDEPSMDCLMWQYTSDGEVNGNGSDNMDMDYYYGDFEDTDRPERDHTDDDIYYNGDIKYRCYTNKWLPTVDGYAENDAYNGYAGVLGQAISGITASSDIPIYVKAHLKDDDRWLPTVDYSDINNINGYAGVLGSEIDGIMIWSADKPIKYRVHTIESGYWLPEVSSNDCNADDWNIGCAGIKGETIDGFMCRFD